MSATGTAQMSATNQECSQRDSIPWSSEYWDSALHMLSPAKQATFAANSSILMKNN